MSCGSLDWGGEFGQAWTPVYGWLGPFAVHLKLSQHDTWLCACVCARSLNCVRLFATPWIVACQAPLSMGFSRQESWSELPFHSPGDLPHPGIEPPSLLSPASAGRFFTTSTTGKPNTKYKFLFFKKVPENVFLVSHFYSNGGLETLTSSFSASPTQRRYLLPSP